MIHLWLCVRFFEWMPAHSWQLFMSYLLKTRHLVGPRRQKKYGPSDRAIQRPPEQAVSTLLLSLSPAASQGRCRLRPPTALFPLTATHGQRHLTSPTPLPFGCRRPAASSQALEARPVGGVCLCPSPRLLSRGARLYRWLVPDVRRQAAPHLGLHRAPCHHATLSRSHVRTTSPTAQLCVLRAHMHNKCSIFCFYEMIAQFEPEPYVGMTAIMFVTNYWIWTICRHGTWLPSSTLTREKLHSQMTLGNHVGYSYHYLKW